MIMAVHVSKLF